MPTPMAYCPGGASREVMSVYERDQVNMADEASVEPQRSAQIFDESYFRLGFGPNAYERSSAWLDFFGRIVDEIIRSLAPRRVLDAGCALGMVVESFWDRGVEAYGLDVSEFAIANVRPDMRPFCRVGSLADPIEGHYDLVTCIEVLEHMPPEAAEAAIRHLGQVTDTILFSSSPSDFEEVTHVNVRPPLAWLRSFGQSGFFPDLEYDASFLVSHAVLLRRRSEAYPDEVVASFAEGLRWRGRADSAVKALQAREGALAEKENELSRVRELEAAAQASIVEMGRAQQVSISELSRARSECDGQLAALTLKLRNAEEASEAARVLNMAAQKTLLELSETNAAQVRSLADIRGQLDHASQALSARTRDLAEVTENRTALEARLQAARGVQRSHARALLVVHQGLAKLRQIEGERWYRLVAAIRSRPLPQALRTAIGSIRDSGLLDEDWYRHTYPDVASYRPDLVDHYVRHGAPEGRNPNAFFDTFGYLERYPDVAENGFNPLHHYVAHGADESRDPGPTFDQRWYLSQYPDVEQSGLNPLGHFLRHGMAEGRLPNPEDSAVADRANDAAIPSINHDDDVAIVERLVESGLFDPHWYARQSQLQLDDPAQLALHYVREGAAQGLDPNPLFDTDWYSLRHPSVNDGAVNPLDHYLRYGTQDELDPGPQFSTRRYLAFYPSVRAAGINPLTHYIQHGIREGLHAFPASMNGLTATQIISNRFGHLRPFPIVKTPSVGSRITLVTDSVNAGSLFGGVATAIIFASLLANKHKIPLRIVTLTDVAQVNGIAAVFASHGVSIPELSFDCVAIKEIGSFIDVSDDDLFVTTSWWSTCNVIQSISSDKVIYVLQEDERMFYAAGDEQLRCSEVLHNNKLKFVVNTKLLYDHLGSTGLKNVNRNGVYFEPAFPVESYYYDNRRSVKKNLFFYARPNNPRNLYYRGLETIDRAIRTGVISPKEWSILLAGKDLPTFEFSDGTVPRICENLLWSDYTALIRTVDLSLTLMFTPHPSYPPLDVVACGGVAVTNAFNSKKDLTHYSGNIICAEPSIEGMMEGLSRGLAKASDPQRMVDYEEQRLSRDWATSMADALAFASQ